MQAELTVPSCGIAWAFGQRHYIAFLAIVNAVYLAYFIHNLHASALIVIGVWKFLVWLRIEKLEFGGDGAGEYAALRIRTDAGPQPVPESELPQATRRIVLVAEGKVFEVLCETGWGKKLPRVGIHQSTCISVSEDTYYPQGHCARTDTRIDVARRAANKTHDQLLECCVDVRQICHGHRIKYEHFHEDNPDTTSPIEEDHTPIEDIEQRYIEEEEEESAHLDYYRDQDDIGYTTYAHD